MKVRLTFTTPILGTRSGNPELTKEFIIAKHPVEPQVDEVEAAESRGDEAVEKATTVFDRDPETGQRMIWDYMVRGHFKEAAGAYAESDLKTKEELKKAGLTKYTLKRTIDRLVFVKPRKIILHVPDPDAPPKFLERPLRAETMRGPRVGLARSEVLPEGTWCEFEIELMRQNLMPFVEDWLDYGEKNGIGQWRGGSFGQFTWEDITDPVKA
jgi:hypothetical protein